MCGPNLDSDSAGYGGKCVTKDIKYGRRKTHGVYTLIDPTLDLYDINEKCSHSTASKPFLFSSSQVL